MDRYAFYVWGSYIAALILIGGEVALLLKRKRDLNRRAQLEPTDRVEKYSTGNSYETSS